MKTFRNFLIAGAIVGLTACSQTDDIAEVILPAEEVPTENVQEYEVPPFPDHRPPVHLSLSESARKVVMPANTFALDMFKSLNDAADKNVCIAPFSVFTALSMAANGDSGDTRDEIVSCLGKGEATLADLNAFSSEALAQLPTLDGAVWCNTANSFWVDGSTDNINPTFNTSLSDLYGTSLFARDFAAADLREEINRWIESKTYGFLKDFITDPVLGKSALINTIYFRGLWWEPFIEEFTDTQNFRNIDGSESGVPTMHKKAFMKINKGNDLTTVILPFAADEFRITVMMPSGNFSDFVGTLTPEKIESVTEAAQRKDVELSIPKFDCEYKGDLLPILEAMGITGIRQQGFDSMLASPVVYDTILHGAHIKIDENGTEAAGAFGLFWSGDSGAVIDFDNEVIIDRPFAYTISEATTGTILFVGQITAL